MGLSFVQNFSSDLSNKKIFTSNIESIAVKDNIPIAKKTVKSWSPDLF